MHPAPLTSIPTGSRRGRGNAQHGHYSRSLARTHLHLRPDVTSLLAADCVMCVCLRVGFPDTAGHYPWTSPTHTRLMELPSFPLITTNPNHVLHQTRRSTLDRQGPTEYYLSSWDVHKPALKRVQKPKGVHRFTLQWS